MIFNPRIVDEACVHAQYLENIGQNKGQPSGSKQKEHHDASKEGKKKWKGGKYKKTTNISQHSEYPNNHLNHCNIDGHTEKKCWKTHPEMNLENHKRDKKKRTF
jgi:hypothetical protein